MIMMNELSFIALTLVLVCSVMFAVAKQSHWISRLTAGRLRGEIVPSMVNGRIIGAVLCLLTLLPFTAFPVAAEQITNQLLTQFRNHPKLHSPDNILDDFVKGKPETAVIIHLKPTVEAQALEAQSTKSHKIPAEFTMAGAPSYYNLHDENVKTQLRATVGEAVDRVVDQIGTPGVTVTQKFSYQFGYAAKVTPEALERIVSSPDVLLVEQDVILQAHLAQGIPLMNATIPRSTYDGSGLSIAICDTGIDTSHPALGGGALFPNSKVIGGYDTGDNDADPRPNGQNHGTCCAGIAAGNIVTVGD